MNSFSWPEKPGMTAFPIARPGVPFIVAAAFTTFILAITGFTFFSLMSLFLTLFICFFFRDPDRLIQETAGAISSPADGKVIISEQLTENPYIDGPCRKISIFMSVFNVHVNRIPRSGTVKDI